MKFSEALAGFLFSLKAEGYSVSTVDLYRIMLNTLITFLQDPEVNTITSQDLIRYFAYLRTDYTPRRNGDNRTPLSGSTLQNHWKAIRSFFKWGEEELKLDKRPDTRLKLPPNNPRVIMPLTENEVKTLIDSAEYTREARTEGRQSFRMKRPSAERDSLLILLLLDTGIRSGEASRLNIRDIDLDTGEIFVSPFGSSQRKTKSRVIPIGKAVKRSLWRYLRTREDTDPEDPLFISRSGRRITANGIRLLLVDLGEKSGVSNCHPHRLRHTFAVEYLRNDGDIFTLQMIMGHSTLDMVKRYLQLARNDTQNVHKRASPADKWKL